MATTQTAVDSPPVPALDLSDPRVAEAIAREVGRVLAAATAAAATPIAPAPAASTAPSAAAAPAEPRTRATGRATAAAADDVSEWDRPVAARRRVDAPSQSQQPAVDPGRVPAVPEAIEAWIAGKKYSRSTANGARQHLLSTRAKGWRKQHGVDTIEQVTGARCPLSDRRSVCVCGSRDLTASAADCASDDVHVAGHRSRNSFEENGRFLCSWPLDGVPGERCRIAQRC
jgi:hypothetical protein